MREKMDKSKILELFIKYLYDVFDTGTWTDYWDSVDDMRNDDCGVKDLLEILNEIGISDEEINNRIQIEVKYWTDEDE